MSLGRAERAALKFNRKVISFLICLLLAILFWLLTTLSKEYTVTAHLPVKYLHLPKGKNAFGELPSHIRTSVKAKGFNFLKFKYFFAKDSLLIDAGSFRHHGYKLFYFAPNSQLDKISSNLDPNVKLIRAFPDTLFFSLNSKKVKRVPVKPNLQLSFEPQYKLLDSVSVSPATVEISGNAEIIAKINYIETKKTTIKNINSRVSKTISLLLPENIQQINLSEQSVTIEIPVERYTEKSISLPVEVLHIPKGKKIKTFPDKVTLKFLVATKDYEKINADSFKVAVDYLKAGSSASRKLKVQIKCSPSYAKKISVIPEKLEYIIKK